ncbi:MAG TPA: hypothetical protein PK028_04345 [Bacteroidales bacterium]|nr:hypothetical protein [Bacteroidales bacterium]MDI9574120.1 hypothetical protein [Bacteroidota bacterium]OQC61084.1 MAG: hypothetical protein BWX51_00610 [Bacteroidetes bacterium ADurb.Bin012]MBP9511676.1 hypothetical protein [Bacteroidales bacterium]MBP9589260.1 hypothetical protein [Bacteroidales bacterium]
MDLIIFISVYLISCFVIAFMAYKKKINWWLALIISVIVTPVGGFIYYQSNNPIKAYKEVRYKCQRCGFYFTEKATFCPFCEHDGHKIPLKKIYVDMT